MTLDVRDQEFWLQEATRKSLTRKLVLCQATLLPNMETKTIQQEMDSLKWKIYEIEHDVEIDERERIYKEMVAKGKHKAPRKKKKAVKK